MLGFRLAGKRRSEAEAVKNVRFVCDTQAIRPHSSVDIVSLCEPDWPGVLPDSLSCWDSVAYSAGQFDTHREIVSSVSPDGKTVLFMGDPKLPSYNNPATAHPIIVQFADQLDYLELRSYEPAESYFPDYVTRKFGELPDFAITGVERAHPRSRRGPHFEQW